MQAFSIRYRWRFSPFKVSFIMEEKLCLKWHDFQENMKSSFRELKSDNDFADVTLACEDGQFQAHKLILSTSSLFLRLLMKILFCYINKFFQKARIQICSFLWKVRSLQKISLHLYFPYMSLYRCGGISSTV